MAYSVLLTNGASSSTVSYALKVDSLTISYSKTPIQVPLPETSPLLIDLGMYRPNISMGGLVDNETAYGDSVVLGGTQVVRGTATTASSLGFAATYTVPTKNELEDFFTDEVYHEADKDLSLIIIDPDGSDFNFYKVAPQSATFIMAPATEDRYSYNITFAAAKRNE
jgi:hypothetical protein